MKVKPICWIALGLALALTISVCDGLKIQDRYSKIAGQLQEAMKDAAADAAVLNQVIADKDKAIEDLNKQILKSEETIGHMTTAIGQKDKDLAALRESWAGFSLECQAKLRELDTKWAEKFTLLESVVAEKDAQLSSWADKFDAQVAISESWKAKYEGSQRLLTISTALNKALVRKVKVQGIIGNIKTGAVLAAAGYIALNAIRGK